MLREGQFVPRQLVDVSERIMGGDILNRPAKLSLVVAPTRLNGLFVHGTDLKLVKGAVQSGVPFTQSAVSYAC